MILYVEVINTDWICKNGIIRKKIYRFVNLLCSYLGRGRLKKEEAMQTRQEAIQYCHSFQDVYEDIQRMIWESYDLTKGKKK